MKNQVEHTIPPYVAFSYDKALLLPVDKIKRMKDVSIYNNANPEFLELAFKEISPKGWVLFDVKYGSAALKNKTIFMDRREFKAFMNDKSSAKRIDHSLLLLSGKFQFQEYEGNNSLVTGNYIWD